MLEPFYAALIGFGMGLAGSIPLAGPTTLVVLSLGLQGRIRSAGAVALGSALPEAIYAGLALWGFGALIERFAWVSPVSQGIAVAVLIGVGLFLLLKPPEEKGEPDETAMSDRAGVVRAFFLGMSFTGLNPALLLNWGAAVTMVYSLGAIKPSLATAIPFALGAAGGILAWFSIVLVVLYRNHRRISSRLRERILRLMGLALIGLAVVAGLRLSLGNWLN